MKGDIVFWFHGLHEKYGPVVRVSPHEVGTSDRESWELIHKMGSGFRKTRFHEKMRVGPEHMLFSMTDVRQHGARRKLFARALTMENLRKNWEAEMRKLVELGVRKMKTEAQTGVTDVFKWWRFTTADVISFLSFGEPFEMMKTGGEKEKEFATALENIGFSIIMHDAFYPFFPWMARVLPFKKLKDLAVTTEIVTRKGDVAIRNLRETAMGRPNLFSNMLAEAETNEKSGLTDDAIRSEAAGMLLAGSDTTSVALTYLIYAVLKQPHLQRRLEEEVAALSGDFTDQDLETLPLLNRVIDESLRVHSPVAGPLSRTTPAGGAYFKGHFIPEGTDVFAQHYTLTNDESLFPNPKEFDETRFENPTEKQRRIAQPFGIGSRSCIGIALARMELRLATALFFRECRGAMLGKNTTEDSMTPVTRFFLAPKAEKCEVTLVKELAQAL